MKISPKDFFLHIGVIATLYTIVISTINLAFALINYTLPVETYYFPQNYSVPVGTLIIVFPVFIFLSWLLNKEYNLYSEKKNFWLRKWLLYLTLFAAGAVIIIDLVVLLISFLNGEFITLNFLLKVLTVFVVATGVFWYYIVDIKNRLTPKNIKISGIIAGIIILVLIVLAFSIMGSPRTQRLLRIDQNKVNDLQMIQYQIVAFWQQKQRLPATLEELEDPISGFRVPLDPQTKEPYGYERKSALVFDLCANFNLPSKTPSTAGKPTPTTDFIAIDTGTWEHEAGEKCFERNIDPELYTPLKR